MKEINTIEKAKQIMANLNIIIYGTIRDIEKHFLNSFSNIEILTHYFNSAYIIILENDSKDNTRNLLIEWHQTIHSPNIKKQILLLDHLDEKYPLRAHRLAYFRNIILDNISKINENNNYQYAFHCDLDDRFWCIDFDSICNCFQYDLNEWEMMSCINKNFSYYDWWALRCENTWFNKNIFSCEANNVSYESKVGEFCDFLKQNQLISVNSAFNGLGIYKLSAIKSCYYSADYYCNKCDNKNRGCMEDNDHIGFHRQIRENNGRLFINTKLIIVCKKKYIIPYNEFILKLQKTIPNITKDPLYYILTNKLITEGLWINFGIKDGEIINQISKYNEKNIFSFDEFESLPGKKDGNLNVYTLQYFNEEIKPFLNKNIKIFPGNFLETIPSFKKTHLNDEFISFLNINSICYQSTKFILNSLVNKIQDNCIITFIEFINYPNYFLHEFKAFYEFVQEYNIQFEFIGANDNLNIKLLKENKYTKKCVIIKIKHNPLLNKIISDNNYYTDKDDDFDWIFYINQYDDLKHVRNEEDALYHWIHHGSIEGRKYNNTNKNNTNTNNTIKKPESTNRKNFDWIFYINQYDDLKHVRNEEDALYHWIHHGSIEGRICKNPLKNKEIKNNHLKKTKNSISTKNLNSLESLESLKDEKNEFELFDWEYYIHKYDDLKNLKTKEDAWYHWMNHGSKEGRTYDSFDWYLYLQLNPDLIKGGIKNKEEAIYHWKHHGKKEGRKYL